MKIDNIAIRNKTQDLEKEIERLKSQLNFSSTCTIQKTEDFDWNNVRNYEIGTVIHEMLLDGSAIDFVIADNGVIAMKQCFEDAVSMSDIKDFIKEKYDLFPDRIKSAIVPRKIDKDEMNVWLFSEKEVFGKNTYGYKEEGKQIEYFKSIFNRAIGKWWWLRSPSAGATNRFCLVHATGSPDALTARSSGGACLGFYVE